ncbi:MAG: adenosine deaminase [Planctomycetota bacterium]
MLIDLHCHVDGAARPATLLELARQAGLRLPADTLEELLPHVRAAPGCRSLADFLATFESFYPVLRTPGAMGRLAAELVQDAAADGVLHLEARFCPALQADAARALPYSSEDVLRETLAGLAAGERAVNAALGHAAASATSFSVGAIICLYRGISLAQNAALLELALRYAGRGVVGLDLAGPEQISGAPLAPLFQRAYEAGLPITIHAGEAAGPESVREALDQLHARRIGHGVAAASDPQLVARLADEGVALECCLTSNVQTGAVPALDVHPFERLRRAGVRVTLNTDDPAVCGTTLSREVRLAAAQWGYGAAELRALSLAAAESAFVSPARRSVLSAAVNG